MGARRPLRGTIEAILRHLFLTPRDLHIGDYTYGRPLVMRYAGNRARITIGKFSSIADGVRIFQGGNHPTEYVSTYPFRIAFSLPGRFHDGIPATRGDVCIGNDVWLCHGCTIMSGVAIGDGAVVAVKAVVTKDVPPYAIVGGVPAHVLRYRFSPEQIGALLRIRWWDWPREKVLANVSLLSSPDVDEFIRLHLP